MIEASKSDLLRPAGPPEENNAPVNVDAILQPILGRGGERFGMVAAVHRRTGISNRGGRPANPHCQAALLKLDTFAELHAVAPTATYSKGWVMRGATLLATGDAASAVTYRTGAFISPASWAKLARTHSLIQGFASLALGWLLVALGSGPCAAEGGAPPRTFRVMTYNIHHGEGLDRKVDLRGIADLIEREQADIVALQEVDKGIERTGRRDFPAELAALTGMSCVFSNNYAFQGGEYGNAVLTHFPVRGATNTHYRMLTPGEQRGILQVVLDENRLHLALERVLAEAVESVGPQFGSLGPSARSGGVWILRLRVGELSPCILQARATSCPETNAA